MSKTVDVDTNCFVSYGAALSYYGPTYGKHTVARVRKMIDDKVIVIGRPTLKEGEELVIDRVEGRYKIRTKI